MNNIVEKHGYNMKNARYCCCLIIFFFVITTSQPLFAQTAQYETATKLLWPLNRLAEWLFMKVGNDGSTLINSIDGKSYKFKEGSSSIWIEDSKQESNVAAEKNNNTLHVPLWFFCGQTLGIQPGSSSSPGFTLKRPYVDEYLAVEGNIVMRMKKNAVDNAELVYIPTGNFTQGKTSIKVNADGYAPPIRTVSVAGYWISRNEVTVGQYRTFCEKSGRAMPAEPEWGWKEKLPITNVSWSDAFAYAKWARMRLPTEVEWEKAARGNDNRIYPWGTAWDAANCVCPFNKTLTNLSQPSAVASLPAGDSPYGLHDMAGNVWEWCADVYVDKVYGNSNYGDLNNMDEKMVMRGGGFQTDNNLRFSSAYRNFFKRGGIHNSIGFRCVADDNAYISINDRPEETLSVLCGPYIRDLNMHNLSIEDPFIILDTFEAEAGKWECEIARKGFAPIRIPITAGFKTIGAKITPSENAPVLTVEQGTNGLKNFRIWVNGVERSWKNDFEISLSLDSPGDSQTEITIVATADGWQPFVKTIQIDPRTPDNGVLTVDFSKKRLRRLNDDAELVYIPAGMTIIGADTIEKIADQLPQHSVYLNGYWIDKYEVSVAQYRSYCTATGATMPAAPLGGWKEDNPIMNVTWEDAAAYAQWVGGRLPTEAEWEKAAHGPLHLLYPWGNSWDTTKANVYPGKRETVPVQSFADGASPYGLFNMAGNVAEWCADWYQSDYYQLSPIVNPTGPASGDGHVIRGGSCEFSRDFAPSFLSRTSTRRKGQIADIGIGFRCVVDASYEKKFSIDGSLFDITK